MILSFNRFLNERYQFKRKYTIQHPARRLNSNVRLRVTILKAIADGIVTEKELKKIIKEAGSRNVDKWLKNNASFFDVVKKYNKNKKGFNFKLSKRALKLWDSL